MDMAINPALLGVMALLFLVGTVLLWFILGKPLTKAMDERAEKISQDLEKAQKAKEEMEELKQDYEKKMVELEERSQKVIADATEAAQKKAQKIEDETQHEIKRQKQAALEQIELERDKAVRELKNQIGELSIEVARTVLEREVSEKDHEQFVKSFLEDLEDRSN